MPVIIKDAILLWLVAWPQGLFWSLLFLAAAAGWHGWVDICKRRRAADQRWRRAYMRQVLAAENRKQRSLDGIVEPEPKEQKE